MPEGIARFALSGHAALEAGRRGLSPDIIRRVVEAPEQTEEIRPGRIVAQSRIQMGNDAKIYSIRVFVDVDREILARWGMKVTYDSRTDTLTVVFREDVQVAESDEDKPGIVLDYDEAGNLISVEILDASSRVSDAGQVHFQRTG